MSTLTLESGALRCELRPDLGGCIAGMWWGQTQVLRSTPAAELASVRAAGSYPLVPYSNRIGQRALHWAGRDYVLPPNFAPEPHTIHGTGWESAWSVEAASATQALLTCSHPADAAWPFAFDSRQTIALGWHPYFAKSASTHIQFAAQGRWEMGADMLPTARLAHSGLDTDCSSLDVDHCFDGWNGLVTLTEGHLRLKISSDLSCLVVFTTPQRDSIAIEPVSHVNNALALVRQGEHSADALGLRVLQPGETFTASMRIQVEQLA